MMQDDIGLGRDGSDDQPAMNCKSNVRQLQSTGRVRSTTVTGSADDQCHHCGDEAGQRTGHADVEQRTPIHDRPCRRMIARMCR